MVPAGQPPGQTPWSNLPQVGNAEQDDGYVPVICGMARTKLSDLDRAWDAVRHARRPRIHTLIATSEIHMKHKLRMTRNQVRGCEHARGCVCVRACVCVCVCACVCVCLGEIRGFCRG
jgi:hypothetical protein